MRYCLGFYLRSSYLDDTGCIIFTWQDFEKVQFMSNLPLHLIKNLKAFLHIHKLMLLTV